MSSFCISLAGTPLKVETLFDTTKDFCKDYLTKEAPEYSITVTQDDIERVRVQNRKAALAEGRDVIDCSDSYLEVLALADRSLDALLEKGVLLFHGAVMAINGKAYIFTAKSGTGKSTHCRLWLDNIPGCHVLNGDKPLLLFQDGTVYACGSPWMGKEGYGKNEILPLAAICILERDTHNHIEEVSLKDSLSTIMTQSHIPQGSQSVLAVLKLMKQLESMKLYQLGCNMDPQAALVSYRAMTQTQPEKTQVPEQAH